MLNSNAFMAGACHATVQHADKSGKPFKKDLAKKGRVGKKRIMFKKDLVKKGRAVKTHHVEQGKAVKQNLAK